MALRFSCKNATLVTGGTAFTHSIRNQTTGAAVAPDEWGIVLRSAGDGIPYVASAPSTTTITVATKYANVAADVFAAFNHTILG